MTSSYTIENCRNCLTRYIKLSKINTVIALQKPVRPATGGEPAGSPLFYIRGMVHMQKIFFNYDQQIEKLKNEKNLLIDNEAYAKEILRQTSYYSLIGGYYV